MKISQMIQALQDIRQKHGEIEVTTSHNSDCGNGSSFRHADVYVTETRKHDLLALDYVTIDDDVFAVVS